MAFRVTKNLLMGRGLFEREFIADQESDISDIDTSVLLMGSGLYVIATGNTYVLNSQREWKVM